MTIRISQFLANVLAGYYLPYILKVYTGSAPASPDDAPTGTLLATFNVSGGAFYTDDGSNIFVLAGAIASTGVANGTAGWARAEAGAGSGATYSLDGTVGTVGTEFILDTTAITIAGAVNLTEATVTYPLA